MTNIQQAVGFVDVITLCWTVTPVAFALLGTIFHFDNVQNDENSFLMNDLTKKRQQDFDKMVEQVKIGYDKCTKNPKLYKDIIYDQDPTLEDLAKHPITMQIASLSTAIQGLADEQSQTKGGQKSLETQCGGEQLKLQGNTKEIKSKKEEELKQINQEINTVNDQNTELKEKIKKLTQELQNITLEDEREIKTHISNKRRVALPQMNGRMHRMMIRSNAIISSQRQGFQELCQEMQKNKQELTQKTSALNRKEEVLGKVGEALERKDNILGNAGEALNRKNNILGNAEEALKKTEEVLGKVGEVLGNAGEALKKTEEALGNAGEALNRKNNILGNAEEALKKTEEVLGNAEEALNRKDNILGNAGEALERKDNILGNAEEALNRKDNILGNAGEALKKTIAQNQDLRQTAQLLIQENEKNPTCDINIPNLISDEHKQALLSIKNTISEGGVVDANQFIKGTPYAGEHGVGTFSETGILSLQNGTTLNCTQADCTPTLLLNQIHSDQYSSQQQTAEISYASIYMLAATTLTAVVAVVAFLATCLTTQHHTPAKTQDHADGYYLPNTELDVGTMDEVEQVDQCDLSDSQLSDTLSETEAESLQHSYIQKQ